MSQVLQAGRILMYPKGKNLNSRTIDGEWRV